MSSSNRESVASVQNTSEDAHADVAVAVEELVNSLSHRFAGVSSEIFAKLDEMSRRLDKLEADLKDGGKKDAASK
ncbi:hypothetical protein VHEMI01167 [[Torrubiella] hemipterigena]|uniref:Heat shock factor binding protein 1 n=1 Tax=[Torrubiella] hemipterigena TaxID=1531966 RepID=A0A0A1T6P2_9HYPO|nr:hypothetical protein VHEMI01167 [[Torrubiella] hemipterigena]